MSVPTTPHSKHNMPRAGFQILRAQNAGGTNFADRYTYIVTHYVYPGVFYYFTDTNRHLLEI
jgi:hypothetical protein